MSHKNIPVFIPHLGCPNMCVFCNQRTISGRQEFDADSVRSIIETSLVTIKPDDEVEIAFFGGSFTGIDRNLMLRLLKTAREYVDRGQVSSIRLSTRPDYIDREILDILKDNKVTHIELGVQSLSDRVLTASKRGHSARQTENACRLIREYGFSLIGQMMLGLPMSSTEAELETAKRLIDYRVDGVRIDPTVVFPSTELERMMVSGAYTPLTVEEGAKRAARILLLLDEHGVPCIRCGLQSQDNFVFGETVLGGAYHPSFGSIAMGEAMKIQIEKALAEINIPEYIPTPDKTYRKAAWLTVFTSPTMVSSAVGHKKENNKYFYNKYNIKLKAVGCEDLTGYSCKIKIEQA